MQEADLAVAVMSLGNSHNCWLPCRERQWVQLHWLLQRQWSTVITVTQAEEALPPRTRHPVQAWKDTHSHTPKTHTLSLTTLLTNAPRHGRKIEQDKSLFRQVRSGCNSRWWGQINNITVMCYRIGTHRPKNEEWESPNNLICPWVPSYCSIVLSEPDKLGGAAESEQERGEGRYNQW